MCKLYLTEMLLLRQASHKMVPVSRIHQDYYNVRNRFKKVLEKLRKNDTIDEPTAFILKNKMTDIIESLIQKKCDKTKGILMTKMLKVEADLAIAGHIIYLKRHSPTDQ